MSSIKKMVAAPLIACIWVVVRAIGLADDVQRAMADEVDL